MIIYNFIKFLVMYIKYNRIVNSVYKEDHILEGLSALFGVELKQDWVGRVYAVINPYIKDGKYDPTAMVSEVGSDLPSDIVVEKYIMERLNAAQAAIRANNLFDLLTYDIEKIDEYENYLFKMYPIPYYDMIKWTKWFVALVAVLVAIGVILLVIL